MIVMIEVLFLKSLNVIYLQISQVYARPLHGTIPIRNRIDLPSAEAEKSGLTSTSGPFQASSDLFFCSLFYVHHSTQVRRGHERLYTILDLLAAVGSEDMKPTRAAANRQVFYPDVRFCHHRLCLYFFCLTSWLKYLPIATPLAGDKAGELHQGHFSANQYNYLEGNVQLLVFTKEALASRPWMIKEEIRRFVYQFL